VTVETVIPEYGELAELVAHEEVIARGLSSFYEVGNALMAIRDGKKYRAAGYETFEAYCQHRWDIGQSHAYRLMDSAKIIGALESSPTGEVPEPRSERQIRPLAKLRDEPEKVAAAWTAAVEDAGGSQPTQQQVEAAVERVQQEEEDVEAEERRRNASPRPAADRSRSAITERETQIRDMAARGFTSGQIADHVGVGRQAVLGIARRIGVTVHADVSAGRTHRHRSIKILTETVHALEGLCMGVKLIDFDELDGDVSALVESYGASLRCLTRVHARLRKGS
jgi:DNA-binding CsgD family transcriptional regulator